MDRIASCTFVAFKNGSLFQMINWHLKKIIISLYNLSIIKAAIAYIQLHFTLCDGEREREERKRKEKEPLGVWLGSFFEACFLRWGKVFGSTVQGQFIRWTPVS